MNKASLVDLLSRVFSQPAIGLVLFAWGMAYAVKSKLIAGIPSGGVPTGLLLEGGATVLAALILVPITIRITRSAFASGPLRADRESLGLTYGRFLRGFVATGPLWQRALAFSGAGLLLATIGLEGLGAFSFWAGIPFVTYALFALLAVVLPTASEGV